MTKLGVSLALIAVLLGTSACSSGQTGSPDCAVPSTCACESMAGAVVLRGRVLAFGSDDVEVEAEEIYSPSALSGIHPGDLIRSRYSVGPSSCYDVSHDPAPSVGDTVLVATWGTKMWLVPWTDPLDLGDRQVPVDSLTHFADHGRCDSDLPQPCDDDGRTFVCATGRARRGSPGWLAMTLIVLGLSLRRFAARRGGRS